MNEKASSNKFAEAMSVIKIVSEKPNLVVARIQNHPENKQEFLNSLDNWPEDGDIAQAAESLVDAARKLHLFTIPGFGESMRLEDSAGQGQDPEIGRNEIPPTKEAVEQARATVAKELAKVPDEA